MDWIDAIIGAIMGLVNFLIQFLGPVGEEIKRNVEPFMIGKIAILEAYAPPSYRIYAGFFGALALVAAFFAKPWSDKLGIVLAKIGIFSLAIAFFWNELFTPIGLIAMILLALGLLGSKWFVLIAGTALLIIKYYLYGPA